MSAKVSPLPKLLPGEKIVKITDFNEPRLDHYPSSIREIERLSRSRDFEGIGRHGPVIASEALNSHRNEAAFRRYEALFGRDALRVALNLLDQYPKLARSTLLKLAELQGVEYNAKREEEPGRIVHEHRDPKVDPVAREISKTLGWGWPYYGSVDSTPEYVRTLTAYCRSSKRRLEFLNTTYIGRDQKTHSISDSLVMAIDWIVGRLDSNKEGLLEFKRVNPNGIENQVWKDSWDSYFHSDGTIASHQFGIASVEVQRVVHDALLDAAEFFDLHIDKPKLASNLRDRAKNLEKQIMTHFWTDKKDGFFVIGTDRDPKGKLRKLEIRTSNMGHLLHSQLLSGDDNSSIYRREAIIKHLFSPEMFGVNGIMTLATDEYRYRDGAYHNGNVWGWDNYFLAQGLRSLGYSALADYVESVLMDSVRYAHKFIEYLRGGHDHKSRINTRIVDIWDDQYKRINRLEQPPQDMQAWTTAAVLAIKFRREQKPLSHMATDPRKRELEKKLLKNISDWR